MQPDPEAIEQLRMLADELSEASEKFPWSPLPTGTCDPAFAGQPESFFVAYWHIAIVSAVKGLLIAITILDGKCAHSEAHVLVRPMLELAGVQHALTDDKKLAVRLTAEWLAENDKYVRDLSSQGWVDGQDRRDLFAWLHRWSAAQSRHIKPLERPSAWMLGQRPAELVKRMSPVAYTIGYRLATQANHLTPMTLSNFVRWDGTLQQARPHDSWPTAVGEATWAMVQVIGKATAVLEQDPEPVMRAVKQWKLISPRIWGGKDEP